MMGKLGARDLAKAKQDEERRVRDLIRRDRDEAYAEEIRRQATLQAENGDFTNLASTVVPPTPEQLEKGEFQTFIPRQPEGTVRVIQTVRRIISPVTQRMAQRGQLSPEGASACKWYAECYERSGLDGPIPSVDMSREVFSAPHDRTVFTDQQQNAQTELRIVRSQMRSDLLPFFDAIVLTDLPLHRAAKLVRMRRIDALAHFRDMAETVHETVESFKRLA